MIETLQEYVDVRGALLRVDRSQAVLRGVKILGQESRNGRTYLPEALQSAAALYEGTKVNVNHPKGSPLASRDYQERIGVLRQVVARNDEGLFADFHFNPKHVLAEQMLWDAEHAPENVGFSHNVEARTARRGDRTVVEAILKVQSVDLVADPATTRGLFEATQVAEGRTALADLTLEALRGARPDLIEVLLSGHSGELLRLRNELSQLQLEEALRQRRSLVRTLLAEFHLPDPDAGDDWTRTVVGGEFLESLLRAPDAAALRRLVQERADLVAAAGRTSGQVCGSHRIVSREQGSLDGSSPEFNPQRFAEALRAG